MLCNVADYHVNVEMHVPRKREYRGIRLSSLWIEGEPFFEENISMLMICLKAFQRKYSSLPYLSE